MKKVVDVCTRIEGHGSVNIYLANQNEDISHVNFDLEVYRGFENILLKKKLFDIPKIASRICGLCHASQAIASCKAIENIYEIIPSDLSILLRRLVMTGELIKSHSMYLLFQSFPDLLTIFGIWNQNKTLYDLLNFNPELTTKFYDLIKIGDEIDRIFGGRSIHSITLIPGGIIFNPSRKNITLARKYFQKALFNLEWIIEKFIELFSNKNPPEDYLIPNPTFFAMSNNGLYDRYTGLLGIKENNQKLINFLDKDYSNYFNKDPDLRGINFYKGDNIIVGPLARQYIIEGYDNDDVLDYLSLFGKSWAKNILFANFLRLIEMKVEIYKAIEILNEPIIDKRESLPSLKEVKNKEGIGLVEAPRGVLIHHYQLDNENSINKIKLFIATEINLPLINNMITRYAQKLYEKYDINIIKKKIQLIIRAFDPCISCATH